MSNLILRAFGVSLALAAGAWTQAPPATASTAAPAPAREPGLYATIQTSHGNVTVKFYEKESPITVKNFVQLALGRKLWTDPKTGQRVKRPLYNGLTFHRVVPAFMIQGGDPLGNGTGGTDIIPDEFHPTLKFDQPGRLAMANAGPKTGSCQFFLTEVPTPHLNGLHTIFGQVVEGQEVVNKIAHLPANANARPNVPVKILKVDIRREGPVPPDAPEGVAAPAKKAVPTKSGTKGAAPAARKAAAPAAKKATPPAVKKQ